MPAVPPADLDRLPDEALCALAAAGCAASQTIMLQRYAPLVSSLLRTFHPAPGIDRADLRQEGNIGLLRAVMKWEKERGAKFITYATYVVRNAIIKELTKQGRQLGGPIDTPGELPQPEPRDNSQLETILASLPPLESQVLRLWAGLDGTGRGDGRRVKRSATAIGRVVGLGREDVLATVERAKALARELSWRVG